MAPKEFTARHHMDNREVTPLIPGRAGFVSWSHHCDANTTVTRGYIYRLYVVVETWPSTSLGFIYRGRFSQAMPSACGHVDDTEGNKFPYHYSLHSRIIHRTVLVEPCP